MVFCAVYSCTMSFMVVLAFDWLSLAVGCTWSYSHHLYSCFIKVMEAERPKSLGFHCEPNNDHDFRFSGG
ncbi:hypothetical protein Hanom_Chr06g00522481 [Helianthus anomalus]